MSVGLSEALLALLVFNSMLGVIAAARRSRTSVAGTPDRLAYLLCAAMVCCALLGVWRYFEYRRAVSQQAAAMQKRLDQFVTPRALRIRSGDALEIGLTFVVECDAFSDAAQREVCAGRDALSEGALARATRDELRNRFGGPIEIGLSPAQRITRDTDEPLLRYLVSKDDIAELMLAYEPNTKRIAITVRRAKAVPMEHDVPFIDADSADTRVSLRLSGCADGACSVTRFGFVVDNRLLCAERLRRSTVGGHEFYSGRVHRCQR